MTDHEPTPEPDDEGAVHVYIESEIPCPACGETFPVRLHVDTLAMLERAGVSEAEAFDRVQAGLLSGRITCDRCAITKQN